MKRLYAFILALSVTLFLQGCYSQGSSAPMPTNVSVVAGDSSATVSWDMLPGVEYWIFKAATANVTPQSCFGSAECQMVMKAVSPAVVGSLTNGTTYSFSINGRIDGGKGGPGSAAIQAVPRLAGAIWTSGTATGTGAVRGIAYGTQYVAVGDTGTIFISTDGISWAAPGIAIPTTATLYAVTYSAGKYIAVGAGGTILSSTDAQTWVQQTNADTHDLYSIAGNGVGGFVAVGASGAVLGSPDGVSWTAATSGTSNTLFDISYANSLFVAVGASGTVIYSSNAVNWSLPTYTNAGTAAQLNSIVYGYAAGSTSGMFVTMGATGALLTSSDGMSWTLQTSLAGTPTINAVTYGRQFIAAGNAGELLTSTDGLNWTLATTATAPLYAIDHGPYDYTATGAAGLNMHSK